MSGTKVTPSNPPTTHESTGPVAPDSLAAESVQAGGAFTSNPSSSSSPNTTTTDNLTSTKPHTTPAEATAALTENKGADKAPTYVNASAGVRGAEAPGQGKVHGKNVTEDEEMVGRPAKFSAEGDVVTGGGETGAGGGAVGGGEGERGGKFDALGSEEA